MVARRHARHAMLPEIGAAGQRLLDASERSVTGPPDAARVTRQYLERAGVTVRDGAPPAPHVEVAAGRPELEPMAAYLSGAWTALEAIKASVGVGRPAEAVAVLLTGPTER